MNLNLKSRVLASALCALGLSVTAFAQNMTPASGPAPASATGNQGLLGTTYAGAEFGYTHHVESSPDILRRYGFVYNQPLPEGLDFTFKYDHVTASELGNRAYSNGFSLGLTGYVPQTWGKPFLTGEVGWVFAKSAGVKDDSFAYTAKAGIEFQVLPQLVIIPYVAYTEAPHFGDRGWNYGAKGVYRFNRQWSGALGAQIDEEHNLEYTLGVNFHY